MVWASVLAVMKLEQPPFSVSAGMLFALVQCVALFSPQGLQPDSGQLGALASLQ